MSLDKKARQPAGMNAGSVSQKAYSQVYTSLDIPSLNKQNTDIKSDKG
jgi:hypothetical protein